VARFVACAETRGHATEQVTAEQRRSRSSFRDSRPLQDRRETSAESRSKSCLMSERSVVTRRRGKPGLPRRHDVGELRPEGPSGHRLVGTGSVVALAARSRARRQSTAESGDGRSEPSSKAHRGRTRSIAQRPIACASALAGGKPEGRLTPKSRSASSFRGVACGAAKAPTDGGAGAWGGGARRGIACRPRGVRAAFARSGQCLRPRFVQCSSNSAIWPDRSSWRRRNTRLCQ